ncbi:hypothetical protein [Streptomyces sp. NPDC014006]|uniref:hypothetical protein n=1 Tax=Streptomyces sp. NPDC014006 TaxID=3364870 RepID=UPI0036FD9B1C
MPVDLQIGVRVYQFIVDRLDDRRREQEVCRWMGQDRVPEAEIRTLFRAILSDVAALPPP